MKIPDELLSAFVNGELEGPERQRIELAMAHDRRIAQRVAKHRALRKRLHAAFDDVLSQPARQPKQPERRLYPGSAQIIDLAAVRVARAQTRRPRHTPRSARFILLTTLAVGLAAGAFLARLQASSALTQYRNGALYAQGALAQALNQQIAGRSTPGTTIRVNGTFRARSGNYCRTFTIEGVQSLGGLACHSGEQWQLQSLLSTGGNVSGTPLNSTAETLLRDHDWK